MKITVLSPIKILHRLIKEEKSPENELPARSLPVGKTALNSRANESDTPENKDKQTRQKAEVLRQDSAAAAPNIAPQTRMNTEKVKAQSGKKRAKGGGWVVIEYRTQYMKNAEIKVFSDGKGLYVSIAVEDENAKNLLSENITELENALEKRYKIRSISVQKLVKASRKTTKNETKTAGFDLRI